MASQIFGWCCIFLAFGCLLASKVQSSEIIETNSGVHQQDVVAPVVETQTENNTSPTQTNTANVGLNSKPLNDIKLSNRTLPGILNLYRRQGFPLVYSSNLVSGDQINYSDPPQGDPKIRLKMLLQLFNLELKANTELTQWFIVKLNSSPQKVSLTILNEKTQRPISGVSANLIRWDGEVIGDPAETNSKGVLQLSLPQLEFSRIRFSIEGKVLASFDVTDVLKRSYITLNLPSHFMEEVIVTSAYNFNKHDAETNAVTLNAITLNTTPSLANDSLKSIQSLPGVATNGLSSKPNVRGGLQDEVLILFDGIELLDPFHLKDYQNLMSGFNPSLLSSMSVYTGAYPARYGGKMSGVIDISTLQDPKTISNNLSLNPFAVSSVLSGNANALGANWTLSARRGLLDETIERVNPDVGSPYFMDIYSRFQWELDNFKNIELSYFSLKDDIRLMSLDEGEGEWMRSQYESQYIWLKSQDRPGALTDNDFSIVFAHILNNRVGYIDEPGNPDESVGNLSDNRLFRFVRAEVNVRNIPFGSFKTSFGGKLGYYDGEYEYQAEALLGELANLIGNPRNLNTNVVSSPDGLAGGVYVEARHDIKDDLSYELGLRLDRQLFYNKSQYQISPRFALKKKFTDTLTGRINVGRYQQAPGINDLDVETGSPTFHRPQITDQYVLGITWQPITAVSGSIEFYQKNVETPRARYENIFNAYSFIPEIAVDRIRIAPESARMRGVEIFTKYSFTADYDIWLGYTFSQAEDEINGEHVARSWNQTPAIQGGININKDRWSLGATLNWHTGWATTRFPDHIDNLDAQVEYQRNDITLPDFFSFDIKASYFHETKSGKFEFFAEVINVTNHENIGFYEKEIEVDTGGGYAVASEGTVSLPIIPSIGLQYNF